MSNREMTRREIRRPLEDMISELVDGLFDLPTQGVRLTAVELGLPVETRMVLGPGGPIVHADMPARRTRTEFDLPLGRLVLRLVTMPIEAER
jgi:hypothetical protein